MAEAAAIKLVCLDLDGTAVDFDDDHAWIADEIVELLNEIGERGAAWCTNSGRSAQNQFGLVQACRPLVNMPVALLAGERHIYWLKPTYRPHEPFNSIMTRRMEELHPQVVAALAPYRGRLRATYTFTYEQDDDRVVGWNLADREQVPELIADLREILAGVADAQVLSNGTWVIITHVEAGKSVVLAETARQLGLSREEILAVGDQMNDVDMLTGRTAAHVGCPADASDVVKHTVRSAGGIVSDLPHTRGTADVIRRAFGPRGA